MSVEETLRSLEDWDFLVAMMQGGCKFTHIPLFGVSVHQDSNSDQRNETAKTAGHMRLDGLQIYRRWPAITAEQRERRERRYNILKSLGFSEIHSSDL
jgi:hypothetical protein